MLTVNSVSRDYGFDITFLAGSAGGERPLTWAHVIDLDDPWNWIGRGELIMTTGGGVPREAPQQEEWMRRVIASGANGLLVAARPGAPRLLSGALRVAERADFPVLAASFGAKFAELAKEIINVSLQRDSKRLAAAQRTFSVYATSLIRPDSVENRLRSIAHSVGIEFEIVDQAGQLVCSSRDSGLRAPVSETSLESWTAPLVSSVRISTGEGDPPDPTLQHSFVTVAAIELQRCVSDTLVRNRAAATLLQGVLNGTLPWEQLVSFLLSGQQPQGHGLCVVVLSGDATEAAIEEIVVQPQLWGLPVVGIVRAGRCVLVCPDAEDALLALRAVLGERAAYASQSISDQNAAQDALGQALLSSEYSVTPGGVLRFDDLPDEGSYLPQDLEKCRALALSVLGPLMRYDEEHGTELLHTLRRYSEHDLSPKRTSEALFVHRHTLMYRLKSIEKVLGYDPSSTRNMVTLWIALEAARRANVGTIGGSDVSRSGAVVPS